MCERKRQRDTERKNEEKEHVERALTQQRFRLRFTVGNSGSVPRGPLRIENEERTELLVRSVRLNQLYPCRVTERVQRAWTPYA